MEYQNQTEKQEPIMLQYRKRMYDGGSEIELIQYLEAKRSLKLTEAQAQVKEMAKPRTKRILETLILGPMELAIGVVGVMTTVIAILAFRQQRNWPLVEQSKKVFKECLRTFGQGVVHSITGPWKAVRLAVVGS